MTLHRIIHHGVVLIQKGKMSVLNLSPRFAPEASMAVLTSASVTFFISLALQHVWIDALNRQNSTKICDVWVYISFYVRALSMFFLRLG